jgi:hypothetical protein
MSKPSVPPFADGCDDRGLLIMMGHHSRSESLFYYFRLESGNQVPENHLLRLIDEHISFEFVRQQLKASYSETGRPSIDPELLLRILLIGYLYGITSERKLVEELRMHLAWRWFTGLSRPWCKSRFLRKVLCDPQRGFVECAHGNGPKREAATPRTALDCAHRVTPDGRASFL